METATCKHCGKGIYYNGKVFRWCHTKTNAPDCELMAAPEENGYILYATFNTDDDAELLYEGKFYCYYAPDLTIRERMPSIAACKELLSTIRVTDGHKCSKYIKNLLAAFIESDETHMCVSGNQEIEIEIHKE